MGKKNKKQENKEQARNAFKLSWTDHAWDEYLFWQASSPDMVEAINKLIEDCKRDPFKGIGKPEPLKANLTGYWSRRITQEHRLVYFFEAGELTIIQCRFHYN